MKASLFLVALVLFAAEADAGRREPAQETPAPAEKHAPAPVFTGREVFLYLENTFSSANLSVWFKPDKLSEFAEKVFLLEKREELLNTDFLLAFAVEGPARGELVKRTAMARECAREIDPTARARVLDLFADNLVERLYELAGQRKSWATTVKERYLHDSNVNQLPDGNTSVTNRDGLSSQFSVGLKNDFRQREIGTPTLELNAGGTQFHTAGFGARNARNATATLSLKRERDAGPLMAITPKLALREDWLNSTGHLKRGFTTYTPGATFMMRPAQKKFSFSDVFVAVYVADFEVRTYTGLGSKDALGRKKDTTTPSLTMVLINFKKWKNFPTQSTALLSLRNSFSDAPEQEFATYRVGYTLALNYPKWSIAPDLAVAGREQRDFQAVKRHDVAGEAGLALAWKPLGSELLKLDISGRLVTQDSNLKPFHFQNQQWALGFSSQF